MGKYSQIKKLSKTEQDELFADFATALASVRNPVEAASFVRDLLSEQEAVLLARRLQIARLLEEGLTYEEIRASAKVGFSTIARVHTWLQIYGEGYRTVLKRTKKSAPVVSDDLSDSWRMLKRKHPLYFWPQLLLEEIVKTATKREKDRLKKVVQDLKDKTKLSKDLLRLLS